MRILVFSLLLLLALPAPTPASDAFVVGVDPQSPPFSSLGRAEFSGFDVDMIYALAKEMNAEAGLAPIKHTEFESALNKGDIDAAISGIFLPEHPAPGLDYSAPYFEGGQRILVRIDTTDVTQAKDLNGLIVGTRLGTPAAETLYKLAPMAMPSLFTRIEDAYRELMRNDLDAVFYDSAAVDAHAVELCQGKVKIVGPVYEQRPYVIALRRDSPFKARLDAAIESLHASGKFEIIRKRWFGEAGATAPCAPKAPAQ